MADLVEEKTAVVTGGSSGNGRAIAYTFAEHGADVVVADIREEPRLGGTSTHEMIEAETDAAATFVECDVTAVEDLRAAVAAADDFGGIDVMVNNAGVIHYEDFLDVTESGYENLMDINTKGVFFGAQAAAERMLGDGGGSIINIASVDALIGKDDITPYCVSKGGVLSMTYALADALGPEIRVNAVNPGLIETAMTKTSPADHREPDLDNRVDGAPLGRVGRPLDVANAVVFLASDLADYVTAESLVVDGGVTNTR